VKKHYNIIEQRAEVTHVRERTYELVHFITDVLLVKQIPLSFPYQVGLHQSCHGQRGLKLSNASEVTPVRDGEALRLLKSMKDIRITELDRNDECCGFGGTFCVAEEAVSSRMGIDRIADHIKNKTEVLTGGDMSCLMHLEGMIKRQQLPIKVMHIAEILNGNSLKS
jgi:L-lactate dehydrogenase complex protein LldE